MARGVKTGGRQAGTPNRTTQAVKDAVVEAFDRAGGVDYLVQLAKNDPRTFCTLVGKVIPLQVDANVTTEIVSKEQRDAIAAAYDRARLARPVIQ